MKLEIGFVVLALAVMAIAHSFPATGTALDTPATRDERTQVMLKTCYPGGQFNGSLSVCREFRKQLADEADRNAGPGNE